MTNQEIQYPDFDTLNKILPASTLANIKKYLPPLLNEIGAAGLISKNQLIAILATVYTETTTLAPIAEYGKGAGKNYGGGSKFHGRGYIQLTHDYNYKTLGEKFNVPLLENPDLALQPDLAAKIFVAYWKGETKGTDIRPYAEKGDWQNVRSIVNAGSPGRWNKLQSSSRKKFMEAVNNGLKYLRGGLQGNFPMSGDYGMGCVEGGEGSNLNLTGVGNPSSMGDALAYALGVYNALNAHSHQFRAIFNPTAIPSLLTLEAQDKFSIVNFGDGLDGDYTVDEIVLYGPHTNAVKGSKSFTPSNMDLEVIAYRPNPDAPHPTIFRSDSNAPLIASGSSATASQLQSGSINEKIYKSAIANKGKTTADSPPVCKGGKLACAYAVNKYAIIPSGLKPLGDGSLGSLSVTGIISAINNGRGQKISIDQVQPGDIWCDHIGNQHTGIFIEEKKVLSNSSSSASFKWIATLEEISNYYGGTGDNFFRVTN